MKTRSPRLQLVFFLIILTLSTNEITQAQSPEWQWAQGIGGTEDMYCYSLAVDPAGSGEVYTTGWFSGTVDFDPGESTYNLTSVGFLNMFISKLDGAGHFVWAKSISGTLYNQGWSIAIDPSGSGDIFITGTFQGTVDFDPGEGIFNLVSHGDADIFISKLDGSGNFQWAKAFGGPGSDVGRSIALDPAGTGKVYVTGAFSGTVDFDPEKDIFNLTSAGDADIFIAKLDVSGNFIWARAIGGTGFDHGYSIAVDPSGNGNVYTTGTFEATADFDPGIRAFNLTATGNRDIFISKLDGAGNLIWAKSMGGAGSDGDGQSIAIDPTGSGDVYTSGYYFGSVDFDPGEGVSDLTGGGMFISKLNGSGNFVWARAISGVVYTSTDRSIVLDPSGSGDVYTTGMFYGNVDFDPGPGSFNLTSDGIADIFVSKLNVSGDFVRAISVGGTGNEVGTSLAFDNSGNVFVAGNYESPSISFGSATLTNSPTFFVDELGNVYFYYTSDIFVSKLTFNPLAVELISFDALYNKKLGGVDLAWATVSEINNNYFTIERSNDLINFEPIVKITGAGNSTSTLHYDAFDPNPEQGKNYYRLRQTDFDGKTSYSQIVTVTADTKSPQISLYPNPASNDLTIELAQAEPFTLGITLFNSSGEAVLSSTGKDISGKETLDISSLGSGIYFIELNVNGNRVIEKVVKE